MNERFVLSQNISIHLTSVYGPGSGQLKFAIAKKKKKKKKKRHKISEVEKNTITRGRYNCKQSRAYCISVKSHSNTKVLYKCKQS